MTARRSSSPRRTWHVSLHFGDSELADHQQESLQQISLGHAIAATCCVPGLFEPLSLRGLYRDEDEGEVEVRLVDGGVFDNQALISLVEADCTHFLCSDASELLRWQSRPEKQIHQVAMRANDIMMDRIRGEVMTELREREEECYEVFVLGSDDGDSMCGENKPRFLTALRDIRTDLDAFTDIEAWALMQHGFSLGHHNLCTNSDQVNSSENWSFSGIKKLAEEPNQAKLFKHLEVGANQFFKVFYLGEKLPWIIVLAPVVVQLVILAVINYLLPPIPRSVWFILIGLALIALAFSQNGRIIEWIDP